MAPEFWTVPWAVSPAVAVARFLDSPRGGREPKRPVSAQGPPMAIDCLADAGPAVACPPVFSEHGGPPAMGASPQSSYLFPSPGPLSPRFTFPRPLVILPPSKNRFRIYGAGKFRLPPAAGNQGRPAGKHMTIFIDPPPGTRRALAIALLLTSLEFSVGRPMSNVMPPAE